MVCSVQDCGPPFVFWQYPMEWFCGICLPFIKSKRNPYSNLVNNMFRKNHLNLLQYVPNVSLSKQDSVQDVDINAEDRFKFESETHTVYLKSPKSKKPQVIPLVDQRVLIQYYIFLSIVEKNAIVLQIEFKKMEKEMAEVIFTHLI